MESKLWNLLPYHLWDRIKYAKNTIFQNTSSLVTNMWGKIKGDDVNKANSTKNFEIHGPWVRILGLGEGPIWPSSKYELIKSWKFFSAFIFIWKKLNVWLWYPWNPLSKPWNSWPVGKGVPTLCRGQYCHAVKCIKS